MKKCWFPVLCLVLVLPLLLAFGCAGGAAQTKASAVSVTCDEFTKQKDIVKDLSVTSGGMFTVTLCSNGSTGFTWGQNSTISDPQILQQTDYKTVAAGNTGGAVGVPGTEVWTFKALKAGAASVSMAYSRPWAGGEKGVQTFTLNVTVK